MTDQWAYLSREEFKSRYALAEFFLRDCWHVTEIGAHTTNLSCAFNPSGGRELELVGPHLPEEGLDYPFVRCHTKTAQEYFRTYERSWVNGLCILGVDFEGMLDVDWATLATFIASSKRTVLEYAEDYAPAVEQVKKLLALSRRPPVINLGVDISSEDPTPFKRRVFLVL